VYVEKLLDTRKLDVLTDVYFVVSMGVVWSAGDGDAESIERDDVRKMEERRLGES
jgi:hypothetical protein